MLNIQRLPVYVTLPSSNLGQTEARRTMPSAINRSAAFEQLALPLFASLYNHAHWLTCNPSAAEDLVRETYTKTLRAFDSFQPDTNFKAWIFRILRNIFLTTRAGIAASRTVFLEDHPDTLETAASGPTPEDTLIRLDNEAALHTALEQLQPQLRDALLLCDVEEIKYRDIASSSMSPSVPSCRASRAPAALFADSCSRASGNPYESNASIKSDNRTSRPGPHQSRPTQRLRRRRTLTR
jgi:RNA polymerase sigma-70 factor (ECF subfamily)